MAGRRYLLQSSGALDTPFYDLPMAPILMPGLGESTTNQLDFGAAGVEPGRFYRVRIVP